MIDRNCVTEALKDLHGEDSKRDVVLCVDDNEAIREMLGGIMRSVTPGLRVVLAENGEDAINQISEGLAEQVAIVFSDTEMPGKNGLELAEALAHMKKVPFVINSGNYDYEYKNNPKGAAMQALIDSGAADVFITKPYGVDQLRDAMVVAVKRVQERFLKQPNL